MIASTECKAAAQNLRQSLSEGSEGKFTFTEYFECIKVLINLAESCHISLDFCVRSE